MTLMVTDPSGNEGEGVFIVNNFQGISITALSYQAEILRNILMNGTGCFTGCNGTVI
jgi:hypothetical protein